MLMTRHTLGWTLSWQAVASEDDLGRLRRDLVRRLGFTLLLLGPVIIVLDRLDAVGGSVDARSEGGENHPPAE
jgi:hypothetical protein